MKPATAAIRFLESLLIPEGPKAGEPVKLAPFQKQFIRGALDPEVNTAVLSIGRGNAKTALSAGLALGALLGKWDEQPRREIIIAARTAENSSTTTQTASHLRSSSPTSCTRRIRAILSYQTTTGTSYFRGVNGSLTTTACD